MALAYAFLDESGKYRSNDVVSFGAVVGGGASSAKLSEEWQALLFRTGLPYFKMSEAVKFEKALSDRIPAQAANAREKSLEPFLACIAEHAELVIVMAMHVSAFQKMSKSVRHVLGSQDDPNYPMFLMTLIYARRFLNLNDSLGVICDEDEEAVLKCFSLYKKVKKTQNALRQSLASITFGDDRIFNQLQAADLIAGLGRLEARRRFSGESHAFISWFDRLSATTSANSTQFEYAFWDEEKLKNFDGAVSAAILANESSSRSIRA
jgi:hypothetical protein